MAPQAADAIDVDKGTVDVEYVEGPPMAWGGRDTGGTIAVITLNRAKSLNSLTYGMIASLASAFRTLRQDGTVCCCVLTGTGRAFCSGVDLTAAAQVFRGDNEADRTNDAVAEMELCPFPIIGAVNGACVTAGFELALACDILVASVNAYFMDSHVKFGIMPSWGLSQKLPRLVGVNRAREVSFTARRIDAVEAKRWGLVTHVCPRNKVLERAMDMAERICMQDKATVAGYKRVLNEGFAGTLEEGRAIERKAAWARYREMGPAHFERMKDFIAARRNIRSRL